ncbi:NRDE family protein [Salibacterium lacus]|uniref:NRDE family protein n=1 Tax=Salibacterium lacus TaxID=1898109 RepID=A0ABW5SXL0_9BACI
MCLIGIGYRVHPDYPLIVAANRDEFFDRPAAPLHSWPDSPIMAGKDLQQGGTWMGVTKSGRFAAVTNVRDPGETKAPKSRGEMVKNFLETDHPDHFFESLQQNRHQYGGYNIVGGSPAGVCYATNQTPDKKTDLSPGIHGLSNAFLNTPWPKVEKIKSDFSRLLKTSGSSLGTEDFFKVLSNSDEADAGQLPDTGVGDTLEKKLSPLFIKMEGYGTRSQTVFMLSKKGDAVLEEKTYLEDAEISEHTRFEWNVEESHAKRND